LGKLGLGIELGIRDWGLGNEGGSRDQN